MTSSNVSNHLQMRTLDIFDDPCWKTIGTKINVPEVVVVGAQSSGKSSVLSEILGIRLPVSADLCTKFPIRIISRQASDWSAYIKIVPDPTRDDRRREDFSRRKIHISGPDQLSKCIQKVAGILGVEHEDAFARDVVEVYLNSPFSPPVTLIDLPGVIEIPASESQTQQDVDEIKNKVAEYLDNPRCICLAIIDGAKDIASNTILRMVTQQGRAARTICVLTKPDMIPDGKPLDRFLELLKNDNTLYQFPLGRHVVLNRSPKETNLAGEFFNEKEMMFFREDRWSSLSADQRGIASLSAGVTRQVQRFVSSQLPKLRDEVDSHLSVISREQKLLPEAVATPRQACEVLDAAWTRIPPLLERTLATSISNIGQPPGHSGSWMVKQSTYQEQAESINRQLMADLLNIWETTRTTHAQMMARLFDNKEASTRVNIPQESPNRALQDQIILRKLAQECFQQSPPAFGEFPLYATIALYHRLTTRWWWLLKEYVERLNKALLHHLEEEMVKDLTRDLLKNDAARHLASVALELFIDGHLKTLQNDIFRRSEPFIFDPHAIKVPSQDKDQTLKELGIFSKAFVESLRPHLEMRKKQSIRETLFEKIGIPDNGGDRLPSSVNFTCDPEELSRALEQAVIGDIFTADDIVTAASEQVKIMAGRICTTVSNAGLDPDFQKFKHVASAKKWIDPQDAMRALQLPQAISEKIQKKKSEVADAVRALQLLDQLRSRP